MNDNLFEPHHLQTTMLDLLGDNKRDIAWSLIDHYYKKASKIEHFDVLGYVSLKAEKRDTYLKCAEALYVLSKNSEQLYTARANLYKAYNMMNYPEKALFYIEQNLRIIPNDLDTLCHKSFNLALMGYKNEAEDLLNDIVKKYPNEINKIQTAFAGKYLREGKTAQGILSFVEASKPINKLFDNTLKMPRWKGIIKPGKILYVDIEGGLGDQFINIRFFNKIKSYGMRPVLVSRKDSYYHDINKLFIRHGYEVLTDMIVIDKNQQWVPMMSLPGYLNLKESDLWDKPYLTPINNSKNIISGKKFKIGIKCSGNPYFAQDEYRKIPIETMKKFLPSNADIFYIDVNPARHEGIIDVNHMITCWDDTLDIINQMDCIVSSCTSLVHAAGAIGKTTFVAVPIAEYYIWTTTKKDGSSPWYGNNFYVAKQTKVRSWDEPLSIIQNYLLKLIEDKS